MTNKNPEKENPRIARTKARALEATLELAAESGIQACTFEAVSERSGIARSTLYRHWPNQSQLVMDALRSQAVERVIPDTGNLRDDMLLAMLELGRALEESLWGSMVPQLIAAAAIDPDMALLQAKNSEFNIDIDIGIIDRAKARGEITSDADSAHISLLFAAPIFYRKLYAREGVDGRWITAHVDNVIALLRAK